MGLGLGDPAFVLKGGPDGKDGVHVHPDDKTDDMPVSVAYKASGDCSDMSGYSSTLPAGGAAKCIKVSGFSIKAGHHAKIDLKFKFRPTDTDWLANPNPQLYFRAGFNFKLTKLITYGYGLPSCSTPSQPNCSTTYSALDNIPVVAAGKRVTAVGGFVFQNLSEPNPGTPATGDVVRLFNTASDAGVSAANPFGTCSSTPVASNSADSLTTPGVDVDGFYFMWKIGNDQDNNAAAALPSGVQYYEQVCHGSTPLVGGLIGHKLGDKEFDEEDYTDAVAPKPASLAIPHHDGKPSNNDTAVVTFSQPLAETTMCAAWGPDNTRDQTLPVTARIQDGGGGNDQLVIQSDGGACGGAFQFGTIDLGSPNYVAADAVFASSKVQWNHNGTLTFTLGGSAATSAVTLSVPATYTPDPAMADTGGNAVTGTASHTAGGSSSHF